MSANFEINQLVMHCREGLATIVGKTTMADTDYFLVKAKNGGGENIYVPISRAESIIRDVMNKDQADTLLLFMKEISEEFNFNTKQRRDAFKRRLSSGDVKDIAYLCRQFYFYKKMMEDGIIKLGAVDLDMLTFADNVLMDELSLSYSLPREQIKEFVVSKIEQL